MKWQTVIQFVGSEPISVLVLSMLIVACCFILSGVLSYWLTSEEAAETARARRRLDRIMQAGTPKAPGINGRRVG